jgi:hypothetical protein
MAPGDRSKWRDVHIYDANDRPRAIRDDSTESPKVIGGLILTNGVTNANFYSMVEIIVVFESDFELRDENDAKIERNDDPLQPGKYYIAAKSKTV